MNSIKTQEKYFYTALQKYRNEQIENYQPGPNHSVGYSNSDHHHHAYRPPNSRDMLQLPTNNYKRSKSGFSILNDEHLYSKHSFYEPPSSEISYDPFRASKQAVLPNHDLHQNITVHRGTSNGSRNSRPATALGHRTGSSLRIQALTKSKRGSAMTHTSSKRSTPSQRSAQMQRSSASRSSMASSYLPSSPPVFVRPSSFKRGVSFSHLRRVSTATARTADTGIEKFTPDPSIHSNFQQDSVGSSLRSQRPSTLGDSPSVRPLQKISARPAIPRLRVRKPESPSKYIQSEARKVSTELEKHMDEAFNRMSMGSSIRTSITSDPHKDISGYETPPTTFSNREYGTTVSGTPENKDAYQHRPLPPIPDETPNTFLQRRLAETRMEIARRFGENGDVTEGTERSERITEVLDYLDSLTMPTINIGKRASSAPAKSPEPSAPLQVIPEEAKEDRFESYISNYRAFTDPVRPGGRGQNKLTEDSTIRIVEQSPAHVAPLTIRKKSETGQSTKSETAALTIPWPGPMRHTSAPSRQNAEAGILSARTNQAVPPIIVPDVPEKKDQTIKKKKSSWFRRTPEEKDCPQEPQSKLAAGHLHIPEAWQDLDDRLKNGPSKATGLNTEFSKQAAKNHHDNPASEFPMRACGTTVGKSEGGGALKNFFNFFAKKGKDDKNKRSLELGGKFISLSILLTRFRHLTNYCR